MADFAASSGVLGGGHKLDWELVFDDSADTVTVTATHTRANGSPAAAPAEAQITLTLGSGASIGLNLVTGRLTNNQLFDGNATTILNSGARTRTNVRLRVSADRAALITHSTEYTPPAG